MKTGHKPGYPQSSLGKILPLPMDTERIKAQAWEAQGILVVDVNDERLDFVDRTFLERIGRRLFGKGE